MALAASPVSRERVRRWWLRALRRTLGGAVALFGWVTLAAGWLLGFSRLAEAVPPLTYVETNSALCHGLAGTALALGIGGRRRRAFVVLAGVVIAAVGALTLAEYVLAQPLGIDDLVARDGPLPDRGRMSPMASCGFLLVGAALALSPLRGARAAGVTQGLAAAVLALALVALAGYAYEVRSLYRVPFYSSVALPSALAFAALGIALLLSRLDAWPGTAYAEEGAEGRVLRHLLPVAAVVPLVGGSLVYAGVEGGIYDAEFAMALFTLASSAVLGAVVLRTAAVVGRAEDAREAQRRWLETTLASIGDAVLATDAERRIVLLNRVASALTGWEPHEAVGRPDAEVLELVDERTGGAPQRDPIARALRGGGPTTLAAHTALVRRDGSKVPIEDSAAPIRDAHGLLGVVLVFRDARARRAAESRLRESEGRFRALFESAGAGFAVIDPERGRVLRVNRKLCALLGRKPEELVGSDYRRLVHPEELAAAEALRAATDPDALEAQLEARLVRADGSTFWAICTVTLLRDEPGAARRAMVVVQDVDELKRYQEEVLAAARHKDQFLAMLGHELRNPLAAIRSAVELQQRFAGPEDDPRRTWSLEVLDRQTRHMSRVIEDLLDVTRIGRGMLRLRVEPVDGAKLLEDVVADLQPLAREKGIALELVPPPPLWLEADPARLYQVLDNLLANAIKFTDPPGRVVASLHAEGEEAVFRVKDTGVGLDPRQSASVFDAFEQARQSIDRPRGGLGLGLALVKGLVELHGGRVSASSPGPGLGSTFEVRLARLPTPAPGAPQLPAEPELPSLRVLVVEDNEDVAESLRVLLELAGHEVWVAHEGRGALAYGRGHPPDVVLCDIGLPGALNGYDVARAFRTEPALRHARLVAVTGYGAPEDRERAKQAGFDQVLVKPVQIEEVEQALRAGGAQDDDQDRTEA